MPSIMTHAAVAVGAGALTRLPRRPLAFWVVSVGVSVLPDLDVLAYALGVPHGSMWSHRGITHSLIAAFVTGTLVAIMSRGRFFSSARTLAIYLSLLMASHGVLDAFTEGGAGVAFFAPFSTARYLFPVRPVPAAPLGLAYFSALGLRAFEAELLWIWLPTALVGGAATLWRAHGR